MGHDEVYVLCGIRPEGGPIWWCSDKEDSALQITDELLKSEPMDLPREEITSMLLKIFAIGDLDAVDPYYRWAVDSSHERDCVGIGHFGDIHSKGHRPCVHHGRPLHPTGDDVQTHRVRNSWSGGFFTELVEFDGGERIVHERLTIQCDTRLYYHDGPSQNMWVHVACWSYVQEWLDCPLQPRLGRSGNPLSFAGELYELVGSRHEPRVDRQAWLPCVDYGGTLDAYMSYQQHQDYIIGCRLGVKHLAEALKAGLRDMQLIPAILKDCNWWMFVRPDM